jgi:hypothetical protein
VPPLDNQSQDNRGIHWPKIVGTLLVQVLVLFALSAAVIGYLNWSSDAAWKEFTAASKTSVPDAKYRPQFSAPVQIVKGHTICNRKG